MVAPDLSDKVYLRLLDLNVRYQGIDNLLDEGTVQNLYGE